MKHAVVQGACIMDSTTAVVPRPGRCPNAMAIISYIVFNIVGDIFFIVLIKNGRRLLPTHPTPRTYVNPTLAT